MKKPSLHPEEALRQETLDSYDILDTQLDSKFQVLVDQARAVVGVPIGLVSLVDKDRQWFKARVGIDAEETPRELAFCAHAILGDDPFVVPDAREDERFQDNPLVVGEPHVAFYAGVPLHARNGMPLGTLCVIDHEPRHLADEQKASLTTLGHQVEVLLELRKRLHDAARGKTSAPPPAPPKPISSTSSLTPTARLLSVTDSMVWKTMPDTVAHALEEFAQTPFQRLANGYEDAGRCWSTATILQLDAHVGVLVSIDVSIEREHLTELAKALFGDDVDEEQIAAVLLEAANVLMGATKLSFEAMDHLMTAGLPRQRDELVQAVAAEGTHAQNHVFADTSHKIIVRITAAPDSARCVRGAEAKAGMVLLEDLFSPHGEEIATCGSRLTTTKAMTIAKELPDREFRVAGADLG